MKKTIEERIVDRCKVININPDEVIYSLTWADVVGLIAEQIVKRNQSLDDLSNDEIQAMLNKAKDYLDGEGMPWHEVATLGVLDAWPARLQNSLQKPKEVYGAFPD